MMSINPSGHDTIKQRRDLGDVVVKGAIALVTVAIFLGAYLQFEVPIWQALVLAIGVYAALMLLHTLVRRSERVEALAKEVIRLESEVANLRGQSPSSGPLSEPNLQAPAATQEASLSGLAPVTKTDSDALDALASPAMPLPRDAQVAAPVAAPHELPNADLAPPPTGGTLPESPELQQTKGSARWPSSAPSAEPVKDYWSFRPASGSLSEKPAKGDAAPQPSGQSEADLEAVQGMLKKLAKEVDVAGNATGGGAALSEQRQESARKASVDALQTAAESMRAADVRAPLPAERARTPEAKGPLPPPIVPVHARLSALGEAISANRIDVLLDPISGLADAKAYHHEVIVRLRDPRGAILPGSLRDPALSKTGLTPLLDSTRLRRAAEVAASLSKTGHKGAVFVATTAESLNSNQFLDAFTDAYRDRKELVGELVLFFSQSEVAAFTRAQWGALTDMRDLGFRFGLEGVSDLNFELTALSPGGFAFVKLGADVFRKGLPTTGGLVPANDICRYLGDLGLTVIVGDIDQEAKRTTALDFGVPLGQGPLFGGPQSIAPPRLAGGRNAAA